MRYLAYLIPLVALLAVLSLPQNSWAQIGGTGGTGGTGGMNTGTTAGGTAGGLGGGTAGGGAGAGGVDNSLDFTTLGLTDAFGASDVFTDTRRATGQTAGADGGGAGGGGQRGGLTSPGGILGQLFGGGQQVQSSGRRTLRAPLRADFDVIRPTTDQVATTLEGRFVNIRPLQDVGGEIRVQLVDRVAVLTGTVQTAKQKDFAERITRLEPGVSTVQNQLVVLNPGE